jgi:predicted amidohydrolase YtcJ
LIEDGYISAVGSNQDMCDAAGAGTIRIDAQGRTVIPGFADCHAHLFSLGRRAKSIDGTGVASIDELVARGRDLISRLKPSPGMVIFGGGLNEENFTVGNRRPNRYDLDRISTVYPVIISRVCGHRLFCNSRALEIAGIADSAPLVEGGEIEQDETGKPTGILSENGAALIWRIIPPPTAEEFRECLEYAMKEGLSHGVTAAASFDANGPNFDLVTGSYRSIYEQGPNIRVSMQCGIGGDEKNLDEYIGRRLRTGQFLFESFLRMGPLKLFADGSLGARTAWLRAPYCDKPETNGLAVISRQVMAEYVKKAAANELQVVVHAIGDAAVETVVSCYEKVISEGINPLRHSVLHCQISDRALLDRMKRSGILVLVQPVFVCHDLYIIESRVGKERAAESYAWNSMEKVGLQVAYGTDCPVESIDPIQGIACAVTRKNAEENYPPGGFCPWERVDIYTAVDNYTTGSAYANFNEKRLGRIAPGYLADLTILDRDIFTIPADEIYKTKVLLAMIGGKTVFEK